MKRFPLHLAIILSFTACQAENTGVMLDTCPNDNTIVVWPDSDDNIYQKLIDYCSTYEDSQDCFEEQLLMHLSEGQYYQERLDSNCRHRSCIDGVWKEDTEYSCKNSCLRPTTDIQTTSKQNLCGECINGEIICDNNNIKQCNNGKYETITYCGFTSCRINADKKQYECGECINGTTKIDNNISNICSKQNCENASWVIDSSFLTCKNSCKFSETGDAKCGECINNKMKCDDGIDQSQLYDCQNGQWHPRKFCTESDSVNPNTGAPHASCTKLDDGSFTCGICLNGDERYTNNKQNICEHKVCKNGQWVLDEDFKDTCQSSCNSDFTGCGSCVNGTGNCDDNTVHNCIDGSWNVAENSCGDVSCVARVYQQAPTVEPCEGEQCTCPDGACDPENGDPENGDPENGDPENGDPENTNPISSQTIVYECGECKNDSIETYNDPSTQQCIRRTCVDGRWNIETPCSQNSCKINGNDFECGDCVNNQYYCQGNDQYVCRNAQKVFNTNCTQCTSSGCYKQCNNANTCTNDSSTQVGIICSANLTTNTCAGVSCNGNVCGSCLNNKVEYRESNNICSQFTCKNAQWTSTTCSNSVSCAKRNGLYSSCGVCSNNKYSYYLSSGVCYYKKCTDGAWGGGTRCASGGSCRGASGNYTGCGECTNGKYRYSQSNNICYYQKCASGAWPSSTTQCSGGVSCKKSGSSYSECGNCKNGATKCASGYKYTCSNGVWGSGSKCAKGCKNSTTCN